MLGFDKYAPYVLSSYGIAAVVLIGVTLWSILRVVSARKKLDEIEPPTENNTETAP